MDFCISHQPMAGTAMRRKRQLEGNPVQNSSGTKTEQMLTWRTSQKQVDKFRSAVAAVATRR
jgi:hypothetical protein